MFTFKRPIFETVYLNGDKPNTHTFIDSTKLWYGRSIKDVACIHSQNVTSNVSVE